MHSIQPNHNNTRMNNQHNLKSLHRNVDSVRKRYCTRQPRICKRLIFVFLLFYLLFSFFFFLFSFFSFFSFFFFLFFLLSSFFFFFLFSFFFLLFSFFFLLSSFFFLLSSFFFCFQEAPAVGPQLPSAEEMAAYTLPEPSDLMPPPPVPVSRRPPLSSEGMWALSYTLHTHKPNSNNKPKTIFKIDIFVRNKYINMNFTWLIFELCLQ